MRHNKYLINLTVILLLLSIKVKASQASDSLMNFYSKKLSTHKYFSAPFVQKRYLSMFKKPMIAKGTLYFSYPNKIKFHYKTPFESVIIFKDGSMQRFRKEKDTFVIQPTMEIVAKTITKEILKYLSGDFSKNFPYDITVNKSNPRKILLVPTSAIAKSIFSNIELVFSKDATFVKSVKLNEPNGNYIFIEHEQPSFKPVPDSIFSIK